MLLLQLLALPVVLHNGTKNLLSPTHVEGLGYALLLDELHLSVILLAVLEQVEVVEAILIQVLLIIGIRDLLVHRIID